MICINCSMYPNRSPISGWARLTSCRYCSCCLDERRAAERHQTAVKTTDSGETDTQRFLSVLYVYDGEQYQFVTDLLWRAPLGLVTSMGFVAPDETKDFVKIPRTQIKPKMVSTPFRLQKSCGKPPILMKSN